MPWSPYFRIAPSYLSKSFAYVNVELTYEAITVGRADGDIFHQEGIAAANTLRAKEYAQLYNSLKRNESQRRKP
jgi:hypothetical protein